MAYVSQGMLINPSDTRNTTNYVAPFQKEVTPEPAPVEMGPGGVNTMEQYLINKAWLERPQEAAPGMLAPTPAPTPYSYQSPAEGFTGVPERGASGNWEATQHDNTDSRYALDYATDRVNTTRGEGNNEQKVQELSQWATDVNRVFRTDRGAFDSWAVENPQDAIRFHGMFGEKAWNGGENRDEHKARAAQLAASIDPGQKSGGIASNFDTFEDLTSEQGPGDIWKLGTFNSKKDSAFGDILNNPITQIVGNIAAPGYFAAATFALNAGIEGEVSKEDVAKLVGGMAPVAGGALSGAVGGAINPTLATAGIAGGATAIAGGDLKDVATTFATSAAVNTVANIAKHAALGDGQPTSEVLNEIMPDSWAKELGGFLDENIIGPAQAAFDVDLTEGWMIDGQEIKSVNPKDVAPNGDFTVDGVTYNTGDITDIVSYTTPDVGISMTDTTGGIIESYMDWRFGGSKGKSPLDGQEGSTVMEYPTERPEIAVDPEFSDPAESSIPPPDIPGDEADIPSEIPEVPTEYTPPTDIPEITQPTPEAPVPPETPDVPYVPGSPSKMGMFGGIGKAAGDWEDFQAGINTNFETLKKLGVTESQYLDMIIAQLRAA